MSHPPLTVDSDLPPSAGLPEPSLAVAAIAQVLQPMARLMIDHGLQLPAMVELLKRALVDEAAATYALADKGSSDSRIAVLTGVHRKDVTSARRTQSAGKRHAHGFCGGVCRGPVD